MIPSGQSAPSVPEIIGQYRVVRPLGRGGMGAVYLGQRVGDFAQTVAIKVLRAGMEERNGEDAILTSLDHPGIVRLLDRGHLPGGAEYLVMEFVNGKPIDVSCENLKLDLGARMKLLQQVVEIAAYAHSKLILHADLKPHNVFVTGEGEVKLLDFGLARWLQDTHLRQPYFSPGYSSPEQQFGQNLTVASDVFSVGRIGVGLAGAELDTTPDLKAILDKASSGEPDDRYGSMRELVEDLKAWQEKRPVKAYRTGRIYRAHRLIQRHRLQAALALALLIVVIGSAVGIGVETYKASQRRRIAQVRLQEIAALTGKLQGDLFTSLPAGEKANAARRELLVLTAQTLDKLERDDDQDFILRQEIASQYAHLAQLQQASGDLQGAAVSAKTAAYLSAVQRNSR